MASSSARFPDITNHWARRGILNGYPDRTFRPNNSVTRAEFAAIISHRNYIGVSTKPRKVIPYCCAGA
ncbi:MAG: S-layer homology domain-containing protein [Rivularia sp. (in: cyanobacteria)]